MGKNRLVYGENTEITYLIRILVGMMLICLGIGVLLMLLGQMAFGVIGLASAVLIAFIVMSERRKQYQKVDGSFLYNEKGFLRPFFYGKRKKLKQLILISKITYNLIVEELYGIIN